MYRIILHLYTYSFLLLAISCGSTAPDISDPITSTVPVQNEGRVISNQHGIAGVVVTDGVNFTLTDQQGKFSLPYSPSVTHVYISSPAGYAVPVMNSVPLFWAALKDMPDRRNIIFELQQLDGSDERHAFIAVGDPQVRNEAELKKLEPILAEMKSTIAQKQLKPVHLMVTGDVVFDRPDMHDRSRAYFRAVEQPVYYTIGNHDYVLSSTVSAANDRILDSTFIRHYGPTNYSFNRGKVHYIVLDNIVYEGGSSPVYRTEITQPQLDWVKKDLSYVAKDKAIVVMFHAPSKTRYGGVQGNSQNLYALLQGYAHVHIISGHTHYNSMVVDQSGITEHTVGAICGGFWEGPVCLDGTPLGYKVFEIDGTDIKWEYHDYLDPEAQFSVFKPASTRSPLLPPKEELLVNVWDWDPTWTVQYSEDDGATFKQMSRYNEQNRVYDIVAYEFFGAAGENRVPGRSWIDASRTDHIFHIIPAPEAKDILIRVQSRFKTYSHKVVLP